MIRDLLRKELIITNIEVSTRTKEEAINIISRKCAHYSGLDERVLSESFLQREALDSTGFGNSVAIPHAKLTDLKDAFIGIFKFTEGVEWEALDDEPVQVAIALVMPNGEGNDTHIKVISNFSRKLMDDDFIEELVKEDDIDKLYDFVIAEMEG